MLTVVLVCVVFLALLSVTLDVSLREIFFFSVDIGIHYYTLLLFMLHSMYFALFVHFHLLQKCFYSSPFNFFLNLLAVLEQAV